MAGPTPRAGGRRAKRTVLARAALILLLAPQLGALWVLHRPSPTSLPPGLVGWSLDVALGAATARCDRATIDGTGRIRLDGLVVGEPSGDWRFEGEARLAPDWRRWLGFEGLSGAVTLRGRVTPSRADGAAAEEVVARLETGATRRLAIALRAGELRLRADLTGLVDGAGDELGEVAADDRQASFPWQAIARELRNLEGGAEIRMSDDRVRVEAAVRGRPGQEGAARWSLGAASAVATLDARGWSAAGRAENFRLGDLRVGSLAAQVREGDLDVAAEAVAWSALTGIAVVAQGDPFGPRSDPELRITAWAGDSRIRTRLACRRVGRLPAVDVVRETAGRLRAEELLRVAPAAQALASAGLDFTGTLEIADGTVALDASGEPLRAEGWVAATGLGWGDVRPALIRPERPGSAVTARAHWEREGELALNRLDIAGLRGSITVRPRDGEPYVVRLASTPGNPVHPSCLNSLLGAWWVDLWKRFDLSTSGTWPHGDVVVKGRWGEPLVDTVQVGAHLGRFGFMGVRFVETRVRVDATPAATVVHLDALTGELDGKPAGGVTGSVTWDWTSGTNRPEIRAEGDLHPGCALRLHDPELAQRLRGAEWGAPWTRVTIKPSGWTRVQARTGSPSRLLGVVLGKFELDLTLDPAAPEPAYAVCQGEWAGGWVRLALGGNLRDRQRIVELEVRDLKVAQFPQALPGWLTPPPAETTPSRAVLHGRVDRGTIDFLDPLAVQAEGTFRFVDPELKKVRVLGGLSQGLDAIGVGVGSYQLTEAGGRFALKDQILTLPDLKISGDDALLELHGVANLKNSQISMEGSFQLKDSKWGVLGYLNPNRLITKVLKIKIQGPLDQPRSTVRPGF